MGLRLYKDEEAQAEILPPQRFFDVDSTDESHYNFRLTAFDAAALAVLFLVTETSCVQLHTPANYQLDGNDIALIQALSSTDTLIAVPEGSMELDFIGLTGLTKVAISQFTARSDADSSCSMLRAYCQDLTINAVNVLENVVIAATPISQLTDSHDILQVGSLITGVVGPYVAGALEGLTAVLNGIDVGIVVANTADTILIADAELLYINTGGLDVFELYAASSKLQFSIALTGPFTSVLSLPDLGPSEQVTVYIKGSGTIGVAPAVLPDVAFTLRGLVDPVIGG